MEAKLYHLQDVIKSTGSLLIAFSGGVDSTLLLKVARDTLGDKVVAVTARSLTYSTDEFNEAREIADGLGVKHITIVSEELDIPGFSDNPPDRCYYCKKELFSKLIETARQEGLNYVADGCNLDDDNDFRPGTRAAIELGIRSPLKEAGLTKEDVRSLSKKLGLPTWNKPALACLASRFPYGNAITREGLEMVSQAEDFLHGLGLKQLRVRHYDNLARIEVPVEDIEQIFSKDLRTRIVAKLKEIGYTYITLDLQGYRSGSMNETLGMKTTQY
ncbi:ATP-dependent sacrificial sulfur transferase LarE [Chloroflexota bacterium]